MSEESSFQGETTETRATLMRDSRYGRAESSQSLETCAPKPDVSQVTESRWQQAHQRFQLISELYEKSGRTRADAAITAARLGCSIER